MNNTATDNLEAKITATLVWDALSRSERAIAEDFRYALALVERDAAASLGADCFVGCSVNSVAAALQHMSATWNSTRLSGTFEISLPAPSPVAALENAYWNYEMPRQFGMTCLQADRTTACLRKVG